MSSTPLPRSIARPVVPPATPAEDDASLVDPRSKRRALLVAASLAAVYLIWSSTYLALRFVVDVFPPLFSAGARFAVAGALLYVGLRLRGAPRPSSRQWLSAVAPGTLMFLCGNGFVAVAEREVSSGLAAVACAAMPILLAVFHAVGGHRPSRREWISIALGFAGVFLLGAGELSASGGARAVLLCAPVGWALGSYLAKRLPLAPGLMSAATQMLWGGAACFIGGAVHRESVPTHATTASVVALAYLVVFGSIVAFSAYSFLLQATRASLATSYAYVNPVLAVALGVVVGHEHVEPAVFVATFLVVAAVITLAWGRSDGRRGPRTTVSDSATPGPRGSSLEAPVDI